MLVGEFPSSHFARWTRRPPWPHLFSLEVPSSEGFAGGVVEIEADANTSGLVERRPHNLVHLFVGDVSAGIGERGMASVPEAAFDSLFWIHHCNIDRLWVQFVGSEGKSSGAIPSTTWLNETPWSFYDHDKTVKMETRAHWMDHRMLGYSYLNEPNPNLSWPTDGPTATAATVAKAARTFRFAASSFRSSDRVVMSSNDISSLVISQEQSRAVQGVASKAVVARPLSGGMERRVILQLLRPHVEKVIACWV